MFTDFERCRRTIGRREVTITSWLNLTKQTWMASAPAFVHLLAASDGSHNDAASRSQAIERVVRTLSERFAARQPG